MPHAVTLHNVGCDSLIPDFNNTFKIVTYGDLYCDPCWNNILRWKKHLNDFRQYKNVSFICYVHANMKDFDIENEKAQLGFPVYLDVNNRFKYVNGLGNNPNELTFLLNKNNEVILMGSPFSDEVKQEYIDIILN